MGTCPIEKDWKEEKVASELKVKEIEKHYEMKNKEFTSKNMDNDVINIFTSFDVDAWFLYLVRFDLFLKLGL